MSSHGLTVPKGWTKGEELTVTQHPQGWMVMQSRSDLLPTGQFHGDDIAYIHFGEKDALIAFLEWWKT